MRQVQTRGGVFGPGGYGGGVFDGSNSGFGGLGSVSGPMYEQAAAGIGLIDPAGQSWNNATYQACVGVAIQSCGAQAYESNWPKSQLDDCLDSAQMKCIAQAKAAAGAPALSSAQVKALQTKINIALQKYEYCPIGVDGDLGPTTCGAAAWAVKTDPSIVVPGACGTTIKMGSGFLKDCPAGAPPPELPPPPPPKPPVTPPVTPPIAPPKKPAATTAWVVGGLLAAAVVAGVAVAAQKKKRG